MVEQVCLLYMELAGLFAVGAAVIFQLMGPWSASLGGDRYYG